MDAVTTKKRYVKTLYSFEERLESDEFCALHEKVRFNLIINLAKIKLDDVVLDAGCGTGFLSIKASKMAASIVALDISKSNITLLQKKAPRNLHTILGDVENLPFRKESFTKIICTETLEHMKSPLDNPLSQLRMVLRPGGKIIMTVPNLLWIWRWLFPHRRIDYDILIHKPWGVFSYFFRKWRNLLEGFHNGFTNENGDICNMFYHAVYSPTYLKKVMSRYFEIREFKSTFKGFYWTLPLIPIQIQRKIAEALITDKSFTRYFGVQIFVLGEKK